MSNEEKRKREEYKSLRMRWIIFQVCLLGLLALAASILFVTHNNINQTYYINYTETGNIDYRVFLTDNTYFEGDYIDENLTPLSTLIDHIEADYKYKIDVEARDIKYKYTYEAYAKVEIIDKNTKGKIYESRDQIRDKIETTSTSNKLDVVVPLNIDFHKYNGEVQKFIQGNNLLGVEAHVSVSVNFNIISDCEEFSNENLNNYIVSLNIPLNEKVIDIKEINSIPNAQAKTIVCGNKLSNNSLLILGIIASILLSVATIVLIVFIYLTRDTHINYEIKIKKIVNAYKSFIQKINNVFDTKGYQVLLVNSIEEMLDIRDTLQSPILMSENDDKTMTQFIIPTNNQILYVYEVKVENYDEIYATSENDIIVESQPVIITEDELESEIIDEETDNFNHLQYNYSFEAKLILSKEEIQNFYKEIIKYIKEYGVKVSRSFKRERIYQGRTLFANLIYRGKTLCILFPLDANDPEYDKYRLIDMSQYKKYSETPSLIKVSSNRKVKYVIEILEKLFISNNISNQKLIVKSEKIKKKSKLALIKEGLIKKINKIK